MDIKELKTYLKEDFVRVEDLIRSSLKSDISLLDSTNEAILNNSGKMLRPMLSLLIARACSQGNISESSIKYAAAAELLHNATLLHDDVADNSSTRRGKPTVFSVLGAQASVLIGDFWLVRAMETVLSAEDSTSRVIKIFSKTLSDLAEGEILQMQKAMRCDTSEQDYIRIIFCKTASLFVASAISAAISVNASSEMEKAIESFAYNLGIAFQIKDDIFDYSDNFQIGKPVGIDLKEQKLTLPLLGALSMVDRQKDEEIRGLVRTIVDKPENEAAIRTFVREMDGVAFAKRRLDEYVQRAIESLDIIPDSKDKQYLVTLAEYVASRDQ